MNTTITTNDLITKLNHYGLETMKIFNELNNWKKRYVFVETEDRMWWWKIIGATKSGKTFEDKGDCIYNAFIHYCNSNPLKLSKEYIMGDDQ